MQKISLSLGQIVPNSQRMAGNQLTTITSIFVSFLLFYSCGQSTDTVSAKNGAGKFSYPYYQYEWHLKNNGQFGGTPGEDINVEDVWASGNRGENVTVGIVDDGLEVAHPGLVKNISQTASSYNYSKSTDDPTPSYSYDSHGTSVAGVIAANDTSVGVKGVAPNAEIVGFTLLSSFTDTHQEDALTRDVDVSNNSWGNYDLGHFYEMDSTFSDTIWEGLNNNREGRGTIYVWAAGNGGERNELSIYDPYDSHIGVISVASVDNNGKHLFYSEKGANLWISAPSGNLEDAQITTTDLVGDDRGYNVAEAIGDYPNYNYTNSFLGTSASAPVVAGVAALILKANPNLSWRDVKGVLARSARRNDPGDEEWQRNGAGIFVNPQYGFGVVDATSATLLATNWAYFPTLVTESYPSAGVQTVNLPIIGSDNLVSSTITISNSSITHIEYVDVMVEINYDNWGRLDIVLARDGENISDQLASEHYCYSLSYMRRTCPVYSGLFTFGVARHFMENPEGNWVIKVKAKGVSASTTGTFINWGLKIYGH